MNIPIKNKMTLEQGLYLEMINQFVRDKNRDKAVNYFKAWGIKYHFFKIESDECGIFENRDNIFVVCSGSEADPVEWKGNFSAYKGLFKSLFGKKREYKKGEAKGYHDNYFFIAYKLLKYFETYCNHRTDKPVIFTGISRGTLVDIAHKRYLLRKRATAPCMCVTYDGPKTITKKRFKEFLKRNKKEYIYHRFLAGDTFVSKVPPRILGWIHTQTSLIKLPRLKFKMDHVNLGEAIKLAIKNRDEDGRS